MNYYTEILKTKENAKGRLRLYSDLEGLAICAGFNGDGTRGNATLRYWSSEEEISPLPEGVVEISKEDFDSGIVAREAAKPVSPPPTQRELDRARLQEIRQKKLDGISLTREELDEVTLLKL